MNKKLKNLLIKIIISSIIFAIAILSPINLYAKLSLYILSYLIVGYEILEKSFKNILSGEIFDENFLMVLASFVAFFLGEYTPEPLGDYMSGTNHVLPTGGTAKFYSALGVYDFVKYSSYSYYPKQVLQTFKNDVMTFANKEGLDGHANSIAVRFKEDESCDKVESKE